MSNSLAFVSLKERRPVSLTLTFLPAALLNPDRMVMMPNLHHVATVMMPMMPLSLAVMVSIAIAVPHIDTQLKLLSIGVCG